jgi:hypothetical protein
MLKKLDYEYWKGEYVYFHDEGLLSPGSKTRVYKVEAGGQALGYIKWMNRWRKYAFFTNNIILDDKCMADLSEFLIMVTEEQRSDWKQQSIVDWDLVERTKNTEVLKQV